MLCIVIWIVDTYFRIMKELFFHCPVYNYTNRPLCISVTFNNLHYWVWIKSGEDKKRHNKFFLFSIRFKLLKVWTKKSVRKCSAHLAINKLESLLISVKTLFLIHARKASSSPWFLQCWRSNSKQLLAPFHTCHYHSPPMAPLPFRSVGFLELDKKIF